jgi:hypothetical protein
MNNSSNLICITFLLFFSFIQTNQNFLKNREIQELSGMEAFCYLNANGTVYNLNPLHKEDNDYEFPAGLLDAKLYVNFCGDSLISCTPEKKGMVTYKNGDQCIDLSGDQTIVSQWTVTSKHLFNF